MGRFLVANVLLAFAVVLGFASSPSYGRLLAAAVAASAGAAYFFWAAGRGHPLRFRVATWAGVALAGLNALQAVLGLGSMFFQ